MQSIRDLSQGKAEDAHVTVRLIALTDDRFPGWWFEIVTISSLGVELGIERPKYFATATRGGVTQRSATRALAWDALEEARERVRGFQAAMLAVSVAP